MLQPLFDESKLQVVDVARGGRGRRTFITEGHSQRMLADVHAGDFVIIQFGHNDSGAVNVEPPGSTRPLRARGTIPGIGNESEEIDNVITGKHETVYSFGWYLRKMIADTRAKGATPILLTLTKTNSWHDGRIHCDTERYRLWTWQTATSEKTAFVDLTRIIADRFQREGPEAVTAQFIDDPTHTNVTGAEANARDVVAGLRAGSKASPLSSMLSKRGLAVKADRDAPQRFGVPEALVARFSFPPESIVRPAGEVFDDPAILIRRLCAWLFLETADLVHEDGMSVAVQFETQRTRRTRTPGSAACPPPSP